MITQTEANRALIWHCTKYGVTMTAAHSAAFCARRFAAANHKDAARISFSRCRVCTRGAKEYKRARRRGIDMSLNRIASSFY